MNIDSDSSSFYITSYSEDERIANDLNKKRENERIAQEAEEKHRIEEYEKYRQENSEDDRSVFNLPGIWMIKFGAFKIKFRIMPCEIVDLVSRRVKFYCTLRYVAKQWMIKRDSLPVPCKQTIYTWYSSRKFDSLQKGVWLVEYIYAKVAEWAYRHQEFRKDKFERYKAGIDVWLDSEDEELFLTEEEILERRAKLKKILDRMIPPQRRPHFGVVTRSRRRLTSTII